MLQVFIALSVTLLLLWVLWPPFVSWAISHKRDDGGLGKNMHDNIGAVVIVLAGVVALVVAVAFVQADEDRTWLDPEPAVTALGVVVGVVFVYSRLVPPNFWPRFYPVVDFSTGEWEDVKLAELDIGMNDQWWPVFLVVHNTSVTPWNNYRITVKFKGGFQLRSEHSSVPASNVWAWPTEFRPTGRLQDFLQMQGGNTLAVAEPQTMRFLVRPPKKSGRYEVLISVVADGRLSESRRKMWVNVKEGLEPPKPH